MSAHVERRQGNKGIFSKLFTQALDEYFEKIDCAKRRSDVSEKTHMGNQQEEEMNIG